MSTCLFSPVDASFAAADGRLIVGGPSWAPGAISGSETSSGIMAQLYQPKARASNMSPTHARCRAHGPYWRLGPSVLRASSSLHARSTAEIAFIALAAPASVRQGQTASRCGGARCGPSVRSCFAQVYPAMSAPGSRASAMRSGIQSPFWTPLSLSCHAWQEMGQ
jgi:hypothetical protein